MPYFDPNPVKPESDWYDKAEGASEVAGAFVPSMAELVRDLVVITTNSLAIKIRLVAIERPAAARLGIYGIIDSDEELRKFRAERFGTARHVRGIKSMGLVIEVLRGEDTRFKCDYLLGYIRICIRLCVNASSVD